MFSSRQSLSSEYTSVYCTWEWENDSKRKKSAQNWIQYTRVRFSRDPFGWKSLIELEFILLWFQRSGTVKVCVYEWCFTRLCQHFLQHTDIRWPISFICTHSFVRIEFCIHHMHIAHVQSQTVLLFLQMKRRKTHNNGIELCAAAKAATTTMPHCQQKSVSNDAFRTYRMRLIRASVSVQNAHALWRLFKSDKNLYVPINTSTFCGIPYNRRIAERNQFGWPHLLICRFHSNQTDLMS